MAGIMWLASYPRSGNTWLRIFLTNYWRKEVTPAYINALMGNGMASERSLFDSVVGVASSDLTEVEIERYRPEAYRVLAKQSDRTLFLKIHDALIYTSDGCSLIPKDASLGVIYIIRNPLDVAVSFAHYSNATLDQTIDRMADETYATPHQMTSLSRHFRMQVLTWSGHVLSWIDEPGLRVHVIRYEDMMRKPLETFAGVIRFVGLPLDSASMQNAIAHSSFHLVQQQERAQGFRERDAWVDTFFRQGETGSWHDVLAEHQIHRIITDHGHVMQRFGYLNAAGKLVE